MKIIDLLAGGAPKPSLLEIEDAALPAGIARSNQPAGPPALSEAIANLGANQEQELVHAPHTWTRARAQTAAPTEASNAVPIVSQVSNLHLYGLANYLIIGPSAAGQSVYLSLGGDVEWFLSNGVYYPSADLVVNAGTGSTLITFPTRDNWHIQVLPWTYPLWAYADLVRIIYGYQPTGRERIALE